MTGGCGGNRFMTDTFSDLPDALVRDLLAQAIPVAKSVEKRLAALKERKSQIRAAVKDQGLIQNKAELDVSREPSVVGVDGSYQMHRLTSLDLCAAAAVAVQGTAKEERNRHWPKPYHRIWVKGLPHDEKTTGLLRATMVAMELELAALAPHDIILLDGSFASLVIYVNQGLSALSGGDLSDALRKRWEESLFNQILAALDKERIIAVPKYTSRTELIDKISLQIDADDKTVATLILQPGEYTQPIPISQPEQPYHLSLCTAEQNTALNELMNSVKIIYFRPFGWLPAIRLEISERVANSRSRMSMLLESIQRQLFTPAIIEPYPLFLADRMVKSLGAGVAVVEQSVAQHVVGDMPDVETSMLCLQNYRTEGGRGGTR